MFGNAIRRSLGTLLLVAGLVVFAACAGSTSDSAVSIGSDASGTSIGSDRVDDSLENSDDEADSVREQSDDGEPETVADDAEAASEEGNGDAEEAAPAAADEGDSPLASFMGWDTGGEFDEDDFVEQEREIERLVQTCMAGQGFEYNPRDVSDDTFYGGTWPGEDLSEEDFAAQYGFGMSTTFDEQFLAGPPEAVDAEEWVDPNGDLMETMSDGEREAWQRALWGEQPDWDEATGLPIDPETGEPTEDYYPGPSGCYGEASEEVYGSFDELNELNDEFEEMYERIQADPRLADLTDQWSECMAEAGFTFAGQDEMWENVFEDFNALQGELFSQSGPGFDVDPEEFESMTDAELDALFAPPELTADQEARLAAIQENEIKVAVASLACDPGLDDAWIAVAADYERQFIEDNRAALEAAGGGS